MYSGILRKGAILGFVEPVDIDSNDLSTETVCETAFQNKDYNLDSTSDTEVDSLNHNQIGIKERSLLLCQQM